MFPIFPLLLYLIAFRHAAYSHPALSQGRSVLQQEIARDRNLLFADEVIR